jgi:hypothetical protein
MTPHERQKRYLFRLLQLIFYRQPVTGQEQKHTNAVMSKEREELKKCIAIGMGRIRIKRIAPLLHESQFILHKRPLQPMTIVVQQNGQDAQASQYGTFIIGEWHGGISIYIECFLTSNCENLLMLYANYIEE